MEVAFLDTSNWKGKLILFVKFSFSVFKLSILKPTTFLKVVKITLQIELLNFSLIFYFSWSAISSKPLKSGVFLDKVILLTDFMARCAQMINTITCNVTKMTKSPFLTIVYISRSKQVTQFKISLKKRAL